MDPSKKPAASASTLPGPTATPDQVQAFILHLLQERGIDETYAKSLPAQWKIGSGREMRAYDPSMYLDIFGAEYGWIIYRDVKLRVHEEKCRKVTYKYAYGECLIYSVRKLSCVSLEAKRDQRLLRLVLLCSRL